MSITTLEAMMMDVDPSMPPQTLRQWVQYLGIPQSSLRLAIEDGRLQGYQFVPRGSIYVEAKEMARFLEASKIGGTA